MSKYSVYQSDGFTLVENNVSLERAAELIGNDLYPDDIEWVLDETDRCDCPNGFVVVDCSAPAPGPYEGPCGLQHI
jgi:hypothetical protein